MISTVIYILILLAACGIDHLPVSVLSHENAVMLQYAVFCTLIVYWAVRAGDRLYVRGIVWMHRVLVFLFMLMMIFSCMQRVVFAGVYPWEHVFWYLQYLPNLGIALISWYMTLYVGQDAHFRLPTGAKLLLIPYALIVLVIVTNDSHELAFRLTERGTAVFGTGGYRFSYFYYIALIWMFGFALLAVVSLYRVMRANYLSAYVLPLLALLAAGLLYAILYTVVHPSDGIGYVGPHAMICFSALGLWEICIAMRLIPSNDGYGTWFRACSVPIEILDQKGEIRYASSGYAEPDIVQTPSAEEPMWTYVTRSFPIAGGSVRWREDVTDLQEMILEREAVARTLAKSNEKLEAQNRIRLQEAKVKERTRLYDTALGETGDRLDTIRKLIAHCDAMTGTTETEDAEQRKTLAVIGLLGAYVKRRSNLVLLAQRSETLPLSELHFCLRESNEALALIPVSTVYANEADETVSVSARAMMRVYDMFQDRIEQMLEEMEYLKMTLKQEAEHVLLVLQVGGAGMRDTNVEIPLTEEGQTV